MLFITKSSAVIVSNFATRKCLQADPDRKTITNHTSGMIRHSSPRWQKSVGLSPAWTRVSVHRTLSTCRLSTGPPDTFCPFGAFNQRLKSEHSSSPLFTVQAGTVLPTVGKFANLYTTKSCDLWFSLDIFCERVKDIYRLLSECFYRWFKSFLKKWILW